MAGMRYGVRTPLFCDADLVNRSTLLHLENLIQQIQGPDGRRMQSSSQGKRFRPVISDFGVVDFVLGVLRPVVGGHVRPTVGKRPQVRTCGFFSP
jgi:hypothetical protein